MISDAIDPSLHAGQPAPPQLDDGFSPPHNAHEPQPPAVPVPSVLPDKSPF